MKIILTGATGFIGKAIASELTRNGSELYCLGNTNLNSERHEANYYKIDITNSEEVRRLNELKEIDAIIHSAGLAHQFGNIEKERFYKTNVTGTKNILELAINLNIKHFILISSTAIYGIEEKAGNEVQIIDEKTACRPQTFYAESKLEAERIALKFCKRNNIKLTIFRLSPVIGENNSGNVARMVEAINRRRFIWIGKGENFKSLIYKNDVAKACRMVLSQKKNEIEIFNLAAEPVLMRDFVAGAAKNLNRYIPGFFVPASLVKVVFQLNDKTLKIKKIKKISATVEKWLSDDVYSAESFEREYNFKPETPIMEALEKQIAEYQNCKRRSGV